MNIDIVPSQTLFSTYCFPRILLLSFPNVPLTPRIQLEGLYRDHFLSEGTTIVIDQLSELDNLDIEQLLLENCPTAASSIEALQFTWK